ncbi:MAG: hypothetical protein COX78_01440 [Candidatus Levybacteria bacterium CG_4_10_14_0_2_um_filter_35_8]|nr:MAG: hypothetical protein COX78_01440 [Candidatus Levybacteria bacterium CG_4_10_14_0_2_um_filter_35_8]
MINFSSEQMSTFLVSFALGLTLSASIILSLTALGYLVIIWYRHRDREKNSIDSTLLQVLLPRDNEIKIDAAEQLFSSLAGLRKSGKLSFLKVQPHIAFEIVGMPQDIRFYVNTLNKYRDLVEKQINGAYPDAEIKAVNLKNRKNDYTFGNEYNIFSEQGKVAFKSLRLKTSDYMPIKVFKDLPTDPLSSLTSVLAKMTEGEGAAIQILVEPADSKWKKNGRNYITHTKKAEANPETAKYSADPKELEGIENKIGKPGFNTVIRVVVSSSTVEAAEAHLSNIVNAFTQFTGANSFTKNKHMLKGLFMTDFIYRYMPMRGQTSVLSSEELATIFHFPNKSVQTPHIFWLNSKRAPAPAQIPESGLFLGMSTFRGLSKNVFM